MTKRLKSNVPTLAESLNAPVTCEFCGKHKACYSFELITSNIICKSCIKGELEHLKSVELEQRLIEITQRQSKQEVSF